MVVAMPTRTPAFLRLASSFLMLGRLIAAPVPAMAQALPVMSAGGPDAAAYGEAAGYPVAPFRHSVNDQLVMVGSYSHYDDVYPAQTVAPADAPSLLRRAPQEVAVAYSFGGQTHSLADYLARNPTTGLLIAHGDTILFEHYQYGRTEHDRFLSQSMAKTVTGMLLGIAVADGAIHSIDDPVQSYVPEWNNTELGRTPVRAFLHMASGLAFTETYDGTDDNAALGRLLFASHGPGPAASVARFGSRVAPPDTVFHYAGRDSETLGLVVARATGRTLAALLEQRIWRPMGAEAAATWTTDNAGQQVAYCCLSATLRDWARFGLLLANGGAAQGQQVIPSAWVQDAVSAVPGSFLAPSADGRRWGYGYQTWLMPGMRHDFALMGIHGQRIFVDPASKLVLVHTAVRVPAPRQPGDAELVALWRALVRQEGGS